MRILNCILFLCLSLTVVGCNSSNNQRVSMTNGWANVFYFNGEKYMYDNPPGSAPDELQYVTDIGKYLGRLNNPYSDNATEVYEIQGINPKENIALKMVNANGTHYVKLRHG